jgi:hypothetical protein
VQWSYHVYGLSLCSDQRIPGLEVTGTGVEPDVEIETGRVPACPTRPGSPCQLVYRSTNQDVSGIPIVEVFQSSGDSSFLFQYCDGVRFRIDCTGRRICFEWPAALTIEDAATYLLGPILGFVLRLRGVVCLHASAIVLAGSAIALVGSNGVGKSTSAARFADLGYRVLSDDLLPLRREGDLVVAESGYPRIRLWPDAVQHLYGAARELPSLTPTWDKRYLDVAGRFQRDGLPLAAIYVLAERGARPAAPSIQPLSRSEAYLALISNTYCNYLLDKSMRELEFDFLGDLLDRVPAHRIVADNEAGATDRLCSLILAHTT